MSILSVISPLMGSCIHYESKGVWNVPNTTLYVDCISNENGRMTKQKITKLYREEIKSFVKKYILANKDYVIASKKLKNISLYLPNLLQFYKA